MRWKTLLRKCCVAISFILWPVSQKITHWAWKSIKIGGDLDFLGMWQPVVSFVWKWSEFIMPAIGLGLIARIMYQEGKNGSRSPHPPVSEIPPTTETEPEASPRQRERVFVDKELTEIPALYRDRTKVRGDADFGRYKGKWTRPRRYTLCDVSVLDQGVFVTCDIDDSMILGGVRLKFDPSYKEYFEHRDPGYSFTAVGKLEEAGAHEIMLGECELVKSQEPFDE